MNLIMKKTAVTKDFLITPVFMTKKKKICCHGNFSVKVATQKALLKCKVKIGSDLWQIETFSLMYF